LFGCRDSPRQQYRDLNFDIEHGKNTLATVIGRNAANWELALLVYGAYVVTAVLVLFGYAPWLVLLTFTLRPLSCRTDRFCNG
jgi:1,4-dihydroxy-2-naphthoate octaprenyltransferase